jgi:hypothetical protein
MNGQSVENCALGGILSRQHEAAFAGWLVSVKENN